MKFLVGCLFFGISVDRLNGGVLIGVCVFICEFGVDDFVVVWCFLVEGG